AFGRVYHGCCLTLWNEKREPASTFIIPLRRESASDGTRDHRGSELRPPVRWYSWNSQLEGEGSSQGVLPTRRTKRITPQDQMSAASGSYLGGGGASAGASGSRRHE